MIFALARFLAGAAASAIDPPLLIGALLIGALMRRYWMAAVAALVLALAVELVVYRQSERLFGDGDFGRALPERIFAALVLASLAYLVRWLVTRRRTPKMDDLP